MTGRWPPSAASPMLPDLFPSEARGGQCRAEGRGSCSRARSPQARRACITARLARGGDGAEGVGHPRHRRRPATACASCRIDHNKGGRARHPPAEGRHGRGRQRVPPPAGRARGRVSRPAAEGGSDRTLSGRFRRRIGPLRRTAPARPKHPRLVGGELLLRDGLSVTIVISGPSTHLAPSLADRLSVPASGAIRIEALPPSSRGTSSSLTPVSAVRACRARSGSPEGGSEAMRRPPSRPGVKDQAASGRPSGVFCHAAAASDGQGRFSCSGLICRSRCRGERRGLPQGSRGCPPATPGSSRARFRLRG